MDSSGERRVKIGFLDANKVYRMERDKVQKFRASGSKTSGIPLKNPKANRERTMELEM